MSKSISKLGGLLALTLAATSLTATAAADKVQLDRIIAIVNDDVVLQSELENRIDLVKERLRASNTAAPGTGVLRNQVLDRLILDNIQLQLAQKQGIRITERQLNQALSDIAARNGMSLEQFRTSLIAEGQGYEQAREQIRREILISQLQQASVNRRIQVSEQEVQNFLEAEENQGNGGADFNLSIIQLPLPQQASPEIIHQTRQQAEQLHAQLQQGADFAELALAHSKAANALQGGALGWRRGSELPARLAQAVRPLQVGSFSPPVKTPNGFYLLKLNDKRGGAVQLVEQRLVSHILLKPNEIRDETQTRRKAEELYRRLQGGDSFALLARELSDDPASGSEGGDLQWVQSGQMVPEFEQVMNATGKGEISAPFKSRFGWHILTVRDIRTQDIGSEMRQEQARATLRKRRFDEELDNWIRELRAQAYIEIKE